MRTPAIAPAAPFAAAPFAIALLAAIAFAPSAAPSARAQPVQGFYMSGGGGGTFQQPAPITTFPPAATQAPATTPAPMGAPMGAPMAAPMPGQTGQAALGYGFAGSGLPLRVEVEGAFMRNRTP